MNLSILELNIDNIFFIAIALISFFLILKPEIGLKKLMNSKENYTKTFGTSSKFTRKFLTFFYY